MRIVIIFLLLFIQFTAIGQASDKYESPLHPYYRAEDLYEKQQYSAARKEFREFINSYTGSKNDPFYIKALYYEGVSALELFNNDALYLLEKFNKEYPESIYKNDLYFQIARYYYQKKDYKRAISYFKKTDASAIDKENKQEYYFKLGYAYFDEGDLAASKLAFFEVKDDTTSQYGTPSLYYFSHICYTDSSYQTALEGFEKLMSDNRFNKVVPYYITQIYYIQHKYQEVVDFAPDKVDSLKLAEQIEMNHIIGDSYYHLGKFDEALPYLEFYNSKSNTTRDDDYALATAYANTGNCVKAVSYYDKVAKIKDVLGQIALYHAGECYVNLNQLLYARNAFDAASQIDHDPMIQEDALYNYAILSYKLDMNAYDEAVEAFTRYLEKYPDSKRKQVIFQYLVNVYTSTKNYQKALESLEKLPNKDIHLKSAYQLIAYNRGIELYQKSDYANAAKAFALVVVYPINNEINAKAIYWTADAYYMQHKYTDAIKNYNAFLATPGSQSSGLRNEAMYNLGYCYLDIKDRQKTQEAFRNFLAQPQLDPYKKADAHMRLADEYYRIPAADNANNLLAIENYKAAFNLKKGFEDQALFYMARVYGFMGKRDEKISNLLDLINNYPNSRYIQRSVEEVAMTYYHAENLDKAERYFNQIIKDYPNTSYVKEAMHYLGDIEFKRGNYSKAESIYMRILAEFTLNDTICQREVSSLADIYRIRKQLDKIEELPKKYACADSIANTIEDDYYRQGFDLYEKADWSNAIVAFDKYLVKFPNGKFYRDALNQKADALYQLKKEAEAIAIYQKTLEAPTDDYTEIAAVRTAKYFYNNNQREAALPYYEKIEEISANPEYLNNARIGLMRCHFLLENYENAIQYANKVMEIQQNNTIKLESEYVKGISLSKESRYAEAKNSLEFVVKNASTVWAAESKYTLALNYFNEGNYTASETTTRELLKMKPGYDFWIAKSLILQTKILVIKKDYFQAENTIKSVVDHYPVKDDGVLQEASELYDEIMQLKTQTKSLTNPSTEPTVIDMNEKTGNQ